MSKTTKNEIAKLGKMKVNELQAKFAEVMGETTRSPNKTFLIRRITEALQAADGNAKTAKAKKPEADALSVEVETAAQTEPTAAGEKLTKLEVPELQARYLEVVGRSTGSDNKAYLIWKIREAQKGRIPVGPRKSAHREGVTFKVLPLRMESDLVDKLDEAWKRQGLHSRMDLFRKSLQAFLANAGEADVAAMLATAEA
ncbi:MAG: hypothetical protein AAB262_02520 [Elusimicrobiota bacterium]